MPISSLRSNSRDSHECAHFVRRKLMTLFRTPPHLPSWFARAFTAANPSEATSSNNLAMRSLVRANPVLLDIAGLITVDCDEISIPDVHGEFDYQVSQLANALGGTAERTPAGWLVYSETVGRVPRFLREIDS